MYADCLVRSKLMFLSHLSEFFICSLSDLSRKLANAGDQVDVAHFQVIAMRFRHPYMRKLPHSRRRAQDWTRLLMLNSSTNFVCCISRNMLRMSIKRVLLC